MSECQFLLQGSVPAAHWVYSSAMAEARIRFELAFEKLSAMIPSEKAWTNWSHAGSAERLLELTKIMCEELSVDEAAVAEGYENDSPQ